MNWINKVFLLAAGLTLAMTLVNYAFGFGWLSLIAAIPIFVAVSVLVAFFLVVATGDWRSKGGAAKDSGGRFRKGGSGRRLPLTGLWRLRRSAEEGLATLPAAPHSVHTV